MRELKGDWRDLFNGFMLALDLRKMFLGFVGLLLSIAVIVVFLGILDHWDPLILRNPMQLKADPQASYGSCVEAVLLPTSVTVDRPVDLSCRGICLSVASSARYILCSPAWGVRLIPLAVFLLLVLIWSYFGGAISRIAAVEVAKDERIETQKALQYVGRKYSAFFWAPLVCILFFALFAFCNAAGGAVGWIVDQVIPGLGGLAVAAFLPLALLSGFLMALIVIGSVFGGPLFHPAVGAEGTDSFDAISRGFSYVYSRPWHYGFYQIVAAVYGTICCAFVAWFGFFMVRLGLGAGRAGMAIFGSGADFDRLLPEPITRLFFGSAAGYSGDSWTTAAGRPVSDHLWDLGFLEIVASIVLLVWLFIVFGMIAGYVVSYLCSSQTLIYFLLRKKVDGIEMIEVFEEKEEGEEEFKPEEPSAAEVSPSPSSSAAPPASPDAGGGESSSSA
jgi:hypothetical protein